MNILHNNYFVQNLVIKSQLVQLKVEKCSEESTTLWSLKLDKKVTFSSNLAHEYFQLLW